MQRRRTLRILFLDAYFYPETIAFSHLERDLIEGLVGAGHDVSVICPTPTRGVDENAIKAYRRARTDSVYGAHVERFWAPKERRNTISRAVRYLWCNLRQYQLGGKYKDIDIIFAVSTPPTQGFIAGKLAKKKSCSFVYSLQDVFPDSMVTTKMTKYNSILWKIGSYIEKKTYSYANSIIVISELVRNNLLAKGVSENKLELISNWIDLDQVRPVERKCNHLFDELHVDRSKFIVLYAGNFGAAQGAEIVIEAARRIKKNPQIQFVVFGAGLNFDRFRRASVTMSNVKVFDLQSPERISQVYSMGNVALIISKVGTGKTGFPSKTWSIMACNTRIIASFDMDSDLEKTIVAAQAGYCVKPEDVDALVSAIEEAYEENNITEVRNMTLRDYVRRNASKESCVNHYIRILEKEKMDCQH